jgi:hypothetical protein
MVTSFSGGGSRITRREPPPWALSDRNKYIDVKFCVHDTFMEKPSSDLPKVQIKENQIIYNFF